MTAVLSTSTDPAPPAAGHPFYPRIDPAIPVLERDVGVQFGLDRRHPVVLRPPIGTSVRALAQYLELFDGSRDLAELLRLGRHPRITRGWVFDALRRLERAGVLLHGARRTRAVHIRLHGLGALADSLEQALSGVGYQVHRSRRYAPEVVPQRWRQDAVVLVDQDVPDPRLVHDLLTSGAPHLSVRVRDATVVVGPFVLPGLTSCLRCIEVTRAERDADWPRLAAQLVGRPAPARASDRLLATSLTINQLDIAFRADPGAPPPSLSATLEFDPHTGTVTRVPWPRRLRCDCAALDPPWPHRSERRAPHASAVFRP